MNDATTYDARVYRTEVYKGRQVTTYWGPVEGRRQAVERGFPHRGASRQLPQRPADRGPERRGVQHGHRQADGLGA